MADDDEMMEPDEDLELEEDAEGPDLDEAELEVADEDFEDDDDSDTTKSGPVRRSIASEDEDDDDDMIAPDDVEADLDTILKDRLVAAEDEVNEDEEEVEERGEAADRLQPKRADEQLCSRCFLLVRQTAPACPVGDDDCPVFVR
jgi:hypothetical protein